MDRIGIDYTSYKDLKGIISVDFPGDPGTSDFQAYVRSLGIDMERYYAFGIEIVALETPQVLKEKCVQILVRDQHNEGRIVRLKGADTLENLLNNLHRISVTIMEEPFTEDQRFELSGEVDLDEGGENDRL